MAKWHVKSPEQGISAVVQAGSDTQAKKYVEAAFELELLPTACVGALIGASQPCDPHAVAIAPPDAETVTEPSAEPRAPTADGEPTEAATREPVELEQPSTPESPADSPADSPAGEPVDEPLGEPVGERPQREPERPPEELRKPVPVGDLILDDSTKAALMEQRVNTVDDIVNLGFDGLVALDKIGTAKARRILAAVEARSMPDAEG